MKVALLHRFFNRFHFFSDFFFLFQIFTKFKFFEFQIFFGNQIFPNFKFFQISNFFRISIFFVFSWQPRLGLPLHRQPRRWGCVSTDAGEAQSPSATLHRLFLPRSIFFQPFRAIFLRDFTRFACKLPRTTDFSTGFTSFPPLNHFSATSGHFSAIPGRRWGLSALTPGAVSPDAGASQIFSPFFSTLDF
jgi:hypothetical protein